jgi:outer membrane protein assembly factor BamE (lipoprotein component of BamABCDE complex)
MASDAFFVEKEVTHYPLVATAAQAANIRSHYPRVAPGMSPAQVVSMLGEPDEIRVVYSASVGRAKPIGHTYWYVSRRAMKSGSADARQEVLVRIHFDRQGLVTQVDHWGL